MQFNSSQREITIKVVYYGPPLSGKTTNLQALHKLLDPSQTGHLTVLDTADDRTLFFDLLPVTTQLASGFSVKLKLFTVPGQVIHTATRRIVLAGADGVAFIADSQRSQSRANNEFWHGMRTHLKENGLDPDATPTVIQFNKRDLPEVRSDAELAEIRSRGKEPIYPAVAIRGEGVVETLRGLLDLVLKAWSQHYEVRRHLGCSPDELIASIFGHLRPLPPEPPTSKGT
ncbi:MAG: GTPase domain-containing protein [Deltaproteobacteria bacterium]|nr:GTPase domain-containing protein [Deltaproteobacteria bacterium]